MHNFSHFYIRFKNITENVCSQFLCIIQSGCAKSS